MATDMLQQAGESANHRNGHGSGGHGFGGGVPDMRALVARAVIPRLHASLRARGGLADHAPHAPAIRRPGVPPMRERGAGCGSVDDGALVGDLLDALLADDVAEVCRRIDAVRAGGRPLDRIYVDLLAPAAVRLGRLVADDLCSAAAGTIAFCNLQVVLRRYAADFYAEGRPRGEAGRALLVSLPAGAGAAQGLQVFGLLLAADFLRREGWEAWTERSSRSASFAEAVLTQWFDVVEVFAGEGDDLDEIAASVRSIRRRGINRRVGVVACGRVFADHPEYVKRVGADHFVADPLAVLPHLARLAGREQRRPS